MNSSFKALVSDIDRETKKLETLIQERDRIMDDLDGEPDSVTLRALGSILHDYYTGLEQIFERIALEMEGSLPEGEDWHRYLDPLRKGGASLRAERLGRLQGALPQGNADQAHCRGFATPQTARSFRSLEGPFEYNLPGFCRKPCHL